jgi:hypothetical protein
MGDQFFIFSRLPKLNKGRDRHPANERSQPRPSKRRRGPSRKARPSSNRPIGRSF